MHARAIIVLAVVMLVCTSCMPASSPASSPTHRSSPSTGEGSGLSATPADTGGTYAIGGRELNVTCSGSGSPSFVIEVGEGMSTDDFTGLRQELATRGTACVYGRAVAQSGTRTGGEIVDDLHALLAQAEVFGPIVLVGHSAGGMFVQLYARRYPEDVIGVVAMNPVPPWGPWMDEAFAVMSEEERAAETAYFGGENGESLDYRTSSEQLDGAPEPVHPLRMLVSDATQCEGVSICERVGPAYETIMRRVAESWPAGRFVLLEAGHEIFRDDLPAVLDAVDEVVAAGDQP